MVIVAAVDRSDRAEAVLTEAETLAEQFGDPVHVVHVLSDSEYYNLQRTNVEKTGQGIEMDDIETVAAEIAAEAAADLQARGSRSGSWETRPNASSVTSPNRMPDTSLSAPKSGH